MSAGVSEQRMKGQGNQALNTSSKHVETEERSIPWSQQVDEAAYEHLSTPTDGNQSGYYESSSGGGGGFQYPPFNVRDEPSSSWSGGARDHGRPSRRTSNDNYDNDGMHGKSFGHQSSHNYFPGNGDYNNSWSSQQHMNSSQHSRKGNYDNSYRSDRSNYHNDNGKVRSIQRGMQNMLLDGNENRGGGGSGSGVSGGGNSGDGPNSSTHNTKSKSSSQTSAVPKQMTWASIASQPAKPTLRTSSTSSTFKKKGPGMPPPPMVPGKHNMDIGTWDTPKNGPALVPPPPPPVVPVPIMEPSPLSQSKSNSGQSNNASSGDRGGSGSGGSSVVVSNVGGHGDRSGGHHSSGPANNQSNQKGSPPLQSSNPQNSLNANQNNSGGPSGNVNHIRPSWMANQNNRSHNNPSQNQRPNINQGWRSERNPSSNSYHGQSQYNKQHSGSPPAQAVNHPPAAVSPPLSNSSAPIPIVERMPSRHDYNPSEIDMEKAAVARFFVIKSFSEDDVHRSIKYEIWCSTERGNKRLDRAYRERQDAGGVVYLFFSVNGSGYFCGMAEMISPVDYNSVSNVWSQNKWKGMFKVKWIYVKDAPNSNFRHIKLENNDNKSVCNSRDTQEVLNDKGVEVLNILHSYQHTSWIFDDFEHYDVIQKHTLKSVESASGPPIGGGNGGNPRSFEGGSSRYRSGERGGGGGGGEQDNDRNYDKYHNSGGFRERDRDRENKNYGRGGYNNYDNRRYDDHRGSYERGGAREGSDGPNNYGQNRDNRENSGGDFHNSRSFHRGEFNRRDDRDRGHSGYNNRDRDNYGDNSNGEFMNRGDGPRSGGFRDHYNRDRGDHYLRGRGRGGNGGVGGGGHRN